MRGQAKRGIVSSGLIARMGFQLSPSNWGRISFTHFENGAVALRRLAYDIVKSNPHMINPFNKEEKRARKKWYYHS